MKLSPIRRVKLYEQIVSIFREKAARGELKPGDKMPPERDLVEQLGVSRAVLREALRVMEVRGVLETVPGEGRIFAGNGSLDLEQISERVRESAVLEVLDAREAVECKAAELAALHATAGDISRIKAIARKADLAIEKQKDSYEANSAFHLAVGAASHNAVLHSLLELLLNLRADIHRTDLLNKEQYIDSFKEHSEIVAAIERRAPASARELMRQHISKTRGAIETGDRNGPSSN